MTDRHNSTKKDSLLIELQYFPCINWIKMLFQYSDIKISAGEPYKKMSFRNRCVIAGSNGLINLSVPVQNGRNVKLPYRQVSIAYTEGWQAQHWLTIVSCYSRSPWFEFYKEGLEEIFKQRFEILLQLNKAILEWIYKILKIGDDFKITFVDEGFENMVDYRDKWMPKNFQEGNGHIRYFQLFEDRIGFQPNLSILDLIFMEGPNAGKLLEKI